MTAMPRQVLLIWIQSALQAARPTDSAMPLEDLARLASELQALEGKEGT
ncbi:MAG TPA: hypothetical protein VNU96_23085 [Burkholderiales bacterium]|jgi:hypothetical protein|nr:hypothetical protein [Burkholderiales bacterium]